MAAFQSFALDGLILPAFFIAFGAAVLLKRPFRRQVDPADLEASSRLVQYLATRQWDTPAGWTMIVAGALIALVRLTSEA